MASHETRVSEILQRFIGPSQWAAIQSVLSGEEGDYFWSLLTELARTIDTMPTTYQTEGKGDQALAILHYFHRGSDWWIIEKDVCEDQLQAFGFVCLHGDICNAEFGYISIEELIENDVELDFYFEPVPIGQIRAKLEGKEDASYETHETG